MLPTGAPLQPNVGANAAAGLRLVFVHNYPREAPDVNSEGDSDADTHDRSPTFSDDRALLTDPAAFYRYQMEAASLLSNLFGVDLVPAMERELRAAGQVNAVEYIERMWHSGSPPVPADEILATLKVVSRPTEAGAVPASAPATGAECVICLEALFPAPASRCAPTAQADCPSAPPSLVPETTAPTAAADACATEGCAPPQPPSSEPSDGSGSCTVLEVRCGHLFHKPCIRQWIERGHFRCPLCRTTFLE